MKFEGKAVVVTGAASGIGRAAAIRFAAEGARVAICDVNEKGLQETAKIIQDAGGECTYKTVNVRSTDEVDTFIADVIEKYCVIDVLVNNAGIGQFNPFPTLSEEEWDAVLDINAKGIFRFSKAVVPNMMENGGGSIVNVTSIMGEFAGIAQSAYNASKGAAKMLTQGMAKDLAECNIRVNAVAPGMVLTGLTRNMFSNDDQRKWFEDKIPMARVGQPEEIAGAIVFLASDDASYITGATLRVDGGMTCATN